MADLIAWANSIVGRTIADRYGVTSVLGMGGNGGVFLAGHTLLGDRPFAVKLIIPNPLAGPIEEQEQRLAREAATALAFVHPRAVQVRDFGFDRENGVMYMAMDYVEGVDLARLISDASAQDRPGEPVFDVGRALGIVYMVLDVLQTAETANVVHRDLKPSNIIVTGKEQEEIKVLDFGLAKVIGAARGAELDGEGEALDPADSQLLARRLTVSGAVVGTVQYMSPEQARGDAVDHRSDLYSTGVMLYEMLTGKLPHAGSNYHHLLFARAAEPAVAVETARPDLRLAAPVRVLLDYALAMEPEKRFQSAEQFSGAVEEAMAESGVEAPPAAGRTSRRGSSAGLPVQDALLAGRTGGSTPPSGSAAGPPLRRRLVIAAIAAACLFVPVAAVLLATTVRDERAALVVRGRARLEEGDVAGAVAALEEACRIRELEGDDRELLLRARAAGALAAAREGAMRGDLDELRKGVDEARGLGAGEGDLAALESLLRTGSDLERAERLVGDRSYVRAKGVLEALPRDLPRAWAERASRTSEAVDLALGRAKELLARAGGPDPGADLESLREAEAATAAFLEDYPHHPSREEAEAARRRLLKRIAGPGPEAVARPNGRKPTGIRIESRGSGLVCSLDGRIVGHTPVVLAEGLDPGWHRVELTDPDGFGSMHDIEVEPGRAPSYVIDHAAAVAAEREAYEAAGAPGSEAPEDVAGACGRYLAGFPQGAKRAEVLRMLRAAERRALAELEGLRREGAPPDAGYERAMSFLSHFSSSERVEEVSAWLAEWREAAREDAAERSAREGLEALLARDGLESHERETALRGFVERFGAEGKPGCARSFVAARLVRTVRVSGRTSLAASAGSGRAVLCTVDPPEFVLCGLASGKATAVGVPGGHSVTCLASDPAGAEVFAGTREGGLVRWAPASGEPPAVVAEFRRPPTSVVALGAGRVLVTDGVERHAVLVTVDERGGATQRRFRTAVARPCLAARNADGRVVALGDSRGTVALHAVAGEGREGTLWRARAPGAVRALAFSPGGRLVAACAGDDGQGRTVVWPVVGGPSGDVTRHVVSSGWLAVLNDDGALLVGGVVVGPAPDAGPVPLRVGAACAVDGLTGHLLAATVAGEARICDLPALLRRVALARSER